MEKQIFALLQQMNDKLDNLEGTLKEHSGILKEHSETLKEHSRILSALRTGQEFQKAEFSEMKLQNAKDFGEIKELLKNQEDSIEILKEETWNNKKNILRVQKTMGLT
jgi:predicted phosphatase